MRAATGGHWRPLEWLQVAADAKPNAGGHWRPLAATCGHSIGCKWLPLRRELNAGGHWRTLADTGGHWRPLAATGGHSIGCKWLQVAASGCRWEENAGGHWRPLDWPQVGASGCRWEKNLMAATGGHWRPLEWLQVAASGWKWPPGVGETIFFTIHPLLGGEYWEFSVACARKIYNILRGRSLGNVKYCTVLISMLREFLLSKARPIWNVLGQVASRSSLFFVAALSSSFNKSFLLIASSSFSLELVRLSLWVFPCRSKSPIIFRCSVVRFFEYVFPLNCFSFLFV